MEQAISGGSTIVQKAEVYRDRLQRLKAELGESEFPWYPYDSFGQLSGVDQLLGGRFDNLLADAKQTSILDIGCGDGDLAFFLESLGCHVIAIDYLATNHNRMRGVHKLKEALNSKVEILSADLDSRFELPEGPFDLVIVLGLLYHLKNPYYLLELLAHHARFCLLSTRITRLTPDGTNIRKTPVAYLLGPDQLNQDETNYWIFSEAGLKRLFYRTRWEICNYISVGDTNGSMPHDQKHDERAFCLLRNRLRTDPGLSAGLLRGWHELEGGHWRWTERTFAVELPTSDLRTDAVLELEFVYPEIFQTRSAPLQLQARVGNTPLPNATYSTFDKHVYRAAIPARLLQKPKVVIQFELSEALPPDARDQRERGIIVLSVGLH